MVKSEGGKPLFSKIDQVGVLVADMDRAAEYYESLGIGPFEALNVTAYDRKVYGKPADDVKNLGKAAWVGEIHFELIQPVSGKSVQRDSLEKRGENINHLGFFTDDLEKGVDILVRQGFNIISSGKFEGGGGFAYFDTDRVGGVQFELLQWPFELVRDNKAGKKESEPLISRINHVGVLVNDMYSVVEYYESLGIGPFEPANRTATDRKVYGKPVDGIKNVAKTAMIGETQFELVQPVSGKSVQREYLDSRGEGISHLGSVVDDVDRETEKWVKQGFNVISNGKFAGGGGFAYIDTDRVGGFQFEIFKWPPK